MSASSMSIVLPLVATVCVLQRAHNEVSSPRILRAIVGNRGWHMLHGDGLSREHIDETALDVVSSFLSVLMFGCYLKAAWGLRGELDSRLLVSTTLSTSTFVLHAAYTVHMLIVCFDKFQRQCLQKADDSASLYDYIFLLICYYYVSSLILHISNVLRIYIN